MILRESVDKKLEFNMYRMTQGRKTVYSENERTENFNQTINIQKHGYQNRNDDLKTTYMHKKELNQCPFHLIVD